MHRRHVRTILVALATTALFIVPSLTAPSATAASKAKKAQPTRTMVVIGDSITSTYNDRRGSNRRGWWSYLGSKLKVRVITHAERGSGYGKHGKSHDGSTRCIGTTFEQRLHDPVVRRDLRAARVVVIAGGVNDFMTCTALPGGGHVLVPSSPEVLRAQVGRTLALVNAIRPGKRSSVYVTVPYGPAASRAANKTWIVSTIRDAAVTAGFGYVDTAGLTLAGPRTHDGCHPNARGSRRMYRDFLTGSDIIRWAPGRSRPAPRPRPSTPTPPAPARPTAPPPTSSTPATPPPPAVEETEAPTPATV